MNLKRLELTGPPVAVVDPIMSNPGAGSAQYACSLNGILAYRSASLAVSRKIVWVDSSGTASPLRSVPGEYFLPRISPDGRRIVLSLGESTTTALWLYDWTRDTMSRLTFASEGDDVAIWAPDGNHIAFQSSRQGPGNIYWMRTDGAGGALRLTDSPHAQRPHSFSPDGKLLAFEDQSPDKGWDIWTLPLDLRDPDRPRPGQPEPFLRTAGTDVSPSFSPDGRWIAYSSAESGVDEVYVETFPASAERPHGRSQVSSGGGMMPIWSRNRRELLYRTLDGHIMVVAYRARDGVFSFEKPILWTEKRLLTWDLNFSRHFDLAPDGKRLSVIVQSDDGGGAVKSQVTFLLNFFDELRRKAP
jgi:serine/threonine-protein kinase